MPPSVPRTSTFDGLMSRCTIRLACACATAARRHRRADVRPRRAACARDSGRCVHPRRSPGPGTAGLPPRRRRRRTGDVRVREPGRGCCLRGGTAGPPNQRGVQELDPHLCPRSTRRSAGEPHAAQSAFSTALARCSAKRLWPASVAGFSREGPCLKALAMSARAVVGQRFDLGTRARFLRPRSNALDALVDGQLPARSSNELTTCQRSSWPRAPLFICETPICATSSRNSHR